MFDCDELKYYGFGLRLGISSLLRNGLRLGMKKTVGKLLQPINSYTRFPEYWFMGQQIDSQLRSSRRQQRPRILDVGSPKCFGMYIASIHEVDVHLTDIYEPAVEESRILWSAIRHRAKGRVFFSVEDARSLPYKTGAFDVVYSMSVVEHVEGESADSDSVREMFRVLRPGGRLVLTVPLGPAYVEQSRMGFKAAAIATNDANRYFFQRIYTPAAASARIVEALPGGVLQGAMTVSRAATWFSDLYGHLSLELRGILGWVNPLMSAACNEIRQGIVPVPGNYSDVASKGDLHGDLMLAWQKPPAKVNTGIVAPLAQAILAEN